MKQNQYYILTGTTRNEMKQYLITVEVYKDVNKRDTAKLSRKTTTNYIALDFTPEEFSDFVFQYYNQISSTLIIYDRIQFK